MDFIHCTIFFFSHSIIFVRTSFFPVKHEKFPPSYTQDVKNFSVLKPLNSGEALASPVPTPLDLESNDLVALEELLLVWYVSFADKKFCLMRFQVVHLILWVFIICQGLLWHFESHSRHSQNVTKSHTNKRDCTSCVFKKLGSSRITEYDFANFLSLLQWWVVHIGFTQSASCERRVKI